MVVDDSVVMRQMLTAILQEDPTIQVIAQAPDPLVAKELLKQHSPDVITLDVEMPHMSGLEFLEKIMTLKPTPVVMISSLTIRGAEATLHALELGAVEYVAKPTADLQNNLPVLAEEIRRKVHVAARARVRPLFRKQHPQAAAKMANTAMRAGEKIIAIGSSTGGVEAVTQILTNLPADCPPILITQHMPATFTTSFAQRLNSLCALTVKEAEQGDRIVPGHVYIAPGNFHLELARQGSDYICKIHQEPAVSGHRPSVDVLFKSVAVVAGRQAVGCILTGMGRDGADGMLAMKRAGATNYGQDEATSVVYGMPKAAFDIGAVDKQYPLKELAPHILEAARSKAL